MTPDFKLTSIRRLASETGLRLVFSAASGNEFSLLCARRLKKLRNEPEITSRFGHRAGIGFAPAGRRSVARRRQPPGRMNPEGKPRPSDPDICLTGALDMNNRIAIGAAPQSRRFIASGPKHGKVQTQRGPPCDGNPQPCFGSRTSARVAPQQSPILSPAGMDYRSRTARVKRGFSSVGHR